MEQPVLYTSPFRREKPRARAGPAEPAVVRVHAGLGEADAVFDWLDRAYAVRDVHVMFLTVDVKWDRYRADPRFGDLLARCGFTTIGTPTGKPIGR